MDGLMLEASQTYEMNSPPTASAIASARASSSPTHSPSAARRFAAPKSAAEIETARQNRVPDKTKQDTKYCMKLWSEWRRHRERETRDKMPEIQQMTTSELTHWLSRFVVEVRKVDGTEYPPNSLYHICAGIQRCLRDSGRILDLFTDLSFTPFQNSLDGEMKRLQSSGLGTKKRQAEVISVDEEEKLWSTGQLGDSNPQQLLDTMVYYCGLYFALRSGREHRQLRRSPAQIEVLERPGERPLLRYMEDVSKNHPGGLKARNVTPKVVYHHSNLDNPERCFVRMYKKYMSLSPPDAPAGSFYLKPASKPTSACWYSCRPVGHNPISVTVARLCRAAGITGFKTNHSLRATSTSRLYQSGVDEQLVMERTGHRSLTGVRSYKRTSDEQREALSDILNGGRKVARTEQQPTISATSSSSDQKTVNLSGSLSLSSTSFSGCTVNFYVGKN